MAGVMSMASGSTLYGCAEQEPHCRQDRLHQAHDQDAACRAGERQGRGERDHLINSDDGASSYRTLAGVFRFVCCNGPVVGEVSNDIRIPHKGNIQNDVSRLDHDPCHRRKRHLLRQHQDQRFACL